MRRIAYAGPWITELEVSYATDASQNGWGRHCYDYIDRFQDEFSDHIGTKFAIATSSCTGALHLGMAGLGIGKGDEVIVADTNFIATIASIVYLGAQPVFIDVLSDTFCLDISKVEEPITERTKAVGVFHGSPESAASHVSAIWSDVQIWWSDDAVVDAVATFKRRYCDDPGHVLDEVRRALLSAAREVQR